MPAVREEPIEIGRFTETGRADGYNNPIMSWVTWRKPLAHVRVIRGKEIPGSEGQRFAETVFRLTFDFYDVQGMDENAQLLFLDKRLDIKGIYPDHATKDETVVEAVESVTPDGT